MDNLDVNETHLYYLDKTEATIRVDSSGVDGRSYRLTMWKMGCATSNSLSCPNGMVMVGAASSRNAYCIDANPQLPKVTLEGATSACQSRELVLCTNTQWFNACVAAPAGLNSTHLNLGTSATDAPSGEWTNSAVHFYGIMFNGPKDAPSYGQSPCGHGWSALENSLHAYRCCL